MVATDMKFAGVMARSGIRIENSASTASTRLVMSSDVRPTSRKLSCEREFAVDRTVAQQLMDDVGNLGFRFVRQDETAWTMTRFAIPAFGGRRRSPVA